LHPEARPERIVLMGGAIAEGNVTPAAEFNIWADPEAAARVFASGST
jgi:pyrimidine-specific ribonucleoside hydrolase